MSSNLPPEIKIVYALLSEEEKTSFEQSNDLTPTSNLEVIEKVLLTLYTKLDSISDAFSFLLGRILFHRGKMDVICGLYSKNKNPGLGLWCALNHLYAGEVEVFETILEYLQEKLQNSVFYAFIYYIYAIKICLPT